MKTLFNFITFGVIKPLFIAITQILLLSKNIIISAIPYIIILVLWQLFVVTFNVPTYLIPSPLKIAEYIISNKQILLINSSITTLEALLGLILASLASVALGVTTLYSSVFIKFFYKALLLIQIIPLVAIAPLIIIWLGFSIGAKVLVVFIICLFPCLVSFLRGSLSINKEFFYLLKSMKATKWQTFKILVLPSSCYSLFSGLKIAVTYSVTGAVIAEYLGAEKGLGVHLARALSSFDTEALFANVFCIVLITLIFYKVLTILEKIITPWNYINKEKPNEYL